MKPFAVVIRYPSRHPHTGILIIYIRRPPYVFRFQRLVEPFQLPVALRVVGRSKSMAKLQKRKQLLKILGDKLAPVVADDPYILGLRVNVSVATR